MITPDGTIHISFLWDDLRDLAGLEPERSAGAPSWTPPSAEASLPPEEYRRCRLCPKACGFDRLAGAHPRCGDAGFRVSNVGLTFGDEPSIRGRNGSGAIMLGGCPLRCPSCHNPEQVSGGEPCSPAEFFRHCRRLLEEGAHNLQILSPTVHWPVLRGLLRSLRSSGFPIPVLLKSSGFESVEELRKLEGLVDIYLPDMKFGGCSSWALRAGVRHYFPIAREAIEEMIRQAGNLERDDAGIARRGVLVRHVEAPLPPEEKAEIFRYLASLEGRAAVSLQKNFVSLE